MAYPRKLLGDGEEIVRDTRPHWKEVLVPAIVFVVTVGVGSYVAAIVREGDFQPWLRGAIALVALLVIGRFAAYPFFRWLTTEYTITNRRIITRVGLVARVGRDMPVGTHQRRAFRAQQRPRADAGLRNARGRVRR